MRLFTALDLPADVRQSLQRLLDRLRPTAQLNWCSVENLHITTKFIGEWPDERLGELMTALGKMPRLGEIRLRLRNVGWFPNERAPRVFWVGIEASASLEALAQALDVELGKLGVPRETRPFSPHLTLARIKGTVDLSRLRRTIQQLPSLEFGEFSTDTFHLYRSDLRPTGAVYTRLASFPLV